MMSCFENGNCMNEIKCKKEQNEIARKADKIFQNQRELQAIISDKWLTNKYIELKEENASLLKENQLLKNEIKQIKFKYEAEINNVKILKKEKENEYQELKNELVIEQAVSDLELETNLSKQLAESHEKLRQTTKSISTLQNEIRLLKEEQARYKKETEKKIEKLKCCISIAHHILVETQKNQQNAAKIVSTTQMINNQEAIEFIDETINEISAENIVRTVKEENIISPVVEIEKNIEESINVKYKPLPTVRKPKKNIVAGPRRTAPVFRGSKTSIMTRKQNLRKKEVVNKNKEVNKAVQLTITETVSKKPAKKRKLFNPSDLSYLENIDN